MHINITKLLEKCIASRKWWKLFLNVVNAKKQTKKFFTKKDCESEFRNFSTRQIRWFAVSQNFENIFIFSWFVYSFKKNCDEFVLAQFWSKEDRFDSPKKKILKTVEKLWWLSLEKYLKTFLLMWKTQETRIISNFVVRSCAVFFN